MLGAMASDFQRRKISGVFGAMDTDGDGFLTETDFRALTARWLDLRGTDASTPAGQKLAAVMMGWWATLDDAAGGGISAAEYERLIAAWNGVGTPSGDVFALLDSDGDGRLSREEFTGHWFEFWAGDDPAAPGSRVFGSV
jgi:hypothetical protein